MLPLFVLAHVGHHLLTAILSPLSAFIRDEFKLDYTGWGRVSSAFALAYGFGQLPAGWLADRIGRRALITVGILGVAVAGMIVGFSNSLVMLVVFLVLMGLMGGGYHPSASPLISMSVPVNQRGRALGFHLIGGSLAFFIAPVVGALIAEAWGWRWSYKILAIPSAILGIAFFILLGRSQKAGTTPSGSGRSRFHEPPPPRGNWRRLIALLANSFIGFGMANSAMAFLTLYMVDRFGISKGTAGALQSLISLAGLWVGPLSGWLSDRIGRVPLILGSSLFSGVFVLLLNYVPWGIPFYALMVFMGINSYLRMPVTEAFIMGQTPEKHRSTIYGVYYLAGQEAGAIFNLFITGPLIDKLGFATIFLIASGVSIGMTIITSFFIWDGDKAIKEAQAR
jgi:MFS family permease